MYAVTTRRLPAGRKSANGTSFVHTTSANLYLINWKAPLWQHGSILSAMQGRGVQIMRADPTVTAVTVLSWVEVVPSDPDAYFARYGTAGE